VVVQSTPWVTLESNVWLWPTFATLDREIHFYTAPMTRTQALRIDVEVTSGPGVEVAVYFANCTVRAKTTPVVMWCFAGHRCEVDLDKIYNFGGFYKGSTVSSAFADGTHIMRIVVTGFASAYGIRFTQSIDTCTALTKDNAPFCSGAGFQKVLMSGSANWFPYKDAKALDQYTNLSISFSCPQNDQCNCAPLSQNCLKYLKELSCELNFGPCDSHGFKKSPDFPLCRTIEHWCDKTFLIAGLPQFTCGQNFYRDGVGYVSASGTPIHPLPKEIEGTTSSLGTGWIVLIGLLILGALLVAAALVLVMAKRSNRHDYSRLAEGDDYSAGNGYQQM